MADKKLGLKETMKLAPKVVLKKNEPDMETTERIVEKLHREIAPVETVEVVEAVEVIDPIPPTLPTSPPVVAAAVAALVEEPTEALVESKRITLDVPLDLYREMKMTVFNRGITLRKYVLEVVAKDLGK